jgi:signal transduction histidine kinase
MNTLMPLMIPNVEQQRIWMHQVAEVLMFGLGLFFVAHLVNTLLLERKMQDQLALAHAQLREYALQIEELAAVQERNRIAREIHDSLGHALTTLNVQLQTAVKLWQHNPAEAQPFLEQAQRLGKVAMQEVRQSVHALRADARTEEPLEQAISALVKEFCQGTGVQVSTRIDLQTVLPTPINKTIYRVIQEALTNVCKHAEASVVKLQLQQTLSYIYLSITDNGQGFQSQGSASGFGLQGMRERVAALRGRLQIDTQPGSGCCIQVEIPLEGEG